MVVTCIKSDKEFSLTKNKNYTICSHPHRGLISIKNDLGGSHIILNSNQTHNVPKIWFDKYFTMTNEVAKHYSGSIETHYGR